MQTIQQPSCQTLFTSRALRSCRHVGVPAAWRTHHRRRVDCDAAQNPNNKPLGSVEGTIENLQKVVVPPGIEKPAPVTQERTFTVR